MEINGSTLRTPLTTTGTIMLSPSGIASNPLSSQQNELSQSCYGIPAPIIIKNNTETGFEPDFIQDVKVLAKDKVVQVIFKDGTNEKAVCSDEDNFSLEIGISICIAKKILGGTGKYNSTIRRALKIIENKKKAEEKQEEYEKIILKKKQKKKEYLEKRKLKNLEEKIKIQEEAYYRAIKRAENDKKTEKNEDEK